MTMPRTYHRLPSSATPGVAGNVVKVGDAIDVTVRRFHDEVVVPGIVREMSSVAIAIAYAVERHDGTVLSHNTWFHSTSRRVLEPDRDPVRFVDRFGASVILS